MEYKDIDHYDILSRMGIVLEEDKINEALRLFPIDEGLNICQRLRWLINQNKILYEKTEEPIYLSIMVCCAETKIMAKKMNNRLEEYKNGLLG